MFGRPLRTAPRTGFRPYRRRAPTAAPPAGGGEVTGIIYSGGSFQAMYQISGSRAVGSTWGIDLGDWPEQNVTVQWTLNGEDISGATSVPYTAAASGWLAPRVTGSINGESTLPGEFITP